MLTDTTIKRLDALGELSKKGKRINGLFRLLENPMLWLQAYINIYANKGATTPGTDGKSLDRFSMERVQRLIKEIKEDHYRFNPVKRVYIPKANGKQRPLGIPSGDDKLISEVVRMILEKIYEPIFHKNAHGFRPGKSCHTALNEIKNRWHGLKWIIDMDIRGYFDNIHHAILIKLLKEKIEDNKFIHLIELMLTAGYVEDWKFHKTFSGTPQGNIVSPLLANIYLHELDIFVETLKTEFNRGKRRASKAEYDRISASIYGLRKKIDSLNQQQNTAEQIHALKQQIKILDIQRKTNKTLEPLDPNYKRLRYCRYADDFVIGIIGSKYDAITVRDKIQKFIEINLQLEIAHEKSHIVSGSKGARFLGYNIAIYSGNKTVRTVRGKCHTRERTMAERMQLYIPQEKLSQFCKNKKYGNYATLKTVHRAELFNLSDAEIIKTYNAEMRGLANYYGLAQNFWSLGKLAWVWQTSLLKTLAGKHKTTIGKITKRLQTPQGLMLTVRSKTNIHIFKIFKLKDVKRKEATYKHIDDMPNTWQFTLSRTELVQRLNARQCEYCKGQTGPFEVHHIRKLSDLKEGKKLWQIIMARRQRKTLVLCVSCHDLLHAGKLPDLRRTKEKQVESRMS